MKTTFYRPIAASVLAGMLVACSSSTTEEQADGGLDATTALADTGGSVGPTDGGPIVRDDAGMEVGRDAPAPDAILSPECAKTANIQAIQALQARQPQLAVRSRAILTVTATFASVADDPSQICDVALTFKDSNGSGAVEPYEDWRLTVEQRATDLLGRLSAAEKAGLLLHPTLTDVPAGAAPLSAATQALVDTAQVRFGLTVAHNAPVLARATWANNLQERAEASTHGIPFVLSLEPAHTAGNGRVKANGFSQWPFELGLAASADPATVTEFAQVVNADYRAIGVRLALSPSADLATEPRWAGVPFTFGEDADAAGAMVAAYVRGLQGTTLGATSVAAVVGHFPGAGPAADGWDARLRKGRFTTYPGGAIDAHLGVFEDAIAAGALGVMSGYAIPQQGPWTGQGGTLAGATIEQVGASFHAELITETLRERLRFGGLVLAPWGAVEDQGLDPLGAPWGVEAQTRAQRVARAVSAGVDQLGGLGSSESILAAVTAGDLAQADVDRAAGHALALMFRLGLFEAPYVDAAAAPALVNTDAAYRAGLRAMNRSMVLVHNELKPAGWLNGTGDGTQSGDKGNAGNGNGRVLPAPPGEPYVAAGCAYFILGNFDLDYIRSVSAGYGELTNDSTSIKNVPVTTAAERMALSDYIFIRLDAPRALDPDSGPLAFPLGSLEYAGANADQLALIDRAQAAIDAWTGATPSQAQIVVIIDADRPPVLRELLSRDVSAIYVSWYGNTAAGNRFADKVFLDVAFGIADGVGRLPVGLPASDVTAAAQQEDVAGDGQDPTFVRGFGLSTDAFE